MRWNIFETPELVMDSLTAVLLELSKKSRPAHISLSGGNTPKPWFAVLAGPGCENVNWDMLHFWWGDERFVAPKDPESNYGQAYTLFLSRVAIPQENIHRIRGEESPEDEVQRYTDEIERNVPKNRDGVPSFDWIHLGMGSDGHTASLFPGQTDYEDRHLISLSRHPESGQLRITKTAYLIEAARRVSYIVLGQEKADLLRMIHSADAGGEEILWPAGRIRSREGLTEWYLDKAAASLLARQT